ncbi:TlyA family RNA methyltransferase [uncultured Helicobacter sp.]|uniref:23S rRNA (cytidine-2'-O)-methyltransferase TlyA n=1 Tax=uncultured Helicobacter sp. TaxID=175537 RepID=UPI00374F32C9
MRLDSLLHKMGYFQSRQKAKEAILAHKVRYDGALLTKPAIETPPLEPMRLEIAPHLVSRAGYKLQNFLAHLTILDKPLQIADSTILDIGSSTGGFAQVLLESGAKHIVCVDVGSAQLHPSLRQDCRITLFENCDIRDFHTTIDFDLITCDVSFISLRLILPAILRFESPSLLLLFKPQFEVGKDAKRNKKGVLQDPHIGEQSLEEFCALLSQTHTYITYKSDILGKEGNAEYFILAQRK